MSLWVYLLPPAGLIRPPPCREGLGCTTGIRGGHGLFLSLSVSFLISSILPCSPINSRSRRSFSPCSRFLSPVALFSASWSSVWALAPALWGATVSPPVSRATSTSSMPSLAFRPSISGPPVCGQLDSTGLGTEKVYWQRPPRSFPLHREARSWASACRRRPDTHNERRRNILETVLSLNTLSEELLSIFSPVFFH